MSIAQEFVGTIASLHANFTLLLDFFTVKTPHVFDKIFPTPTRLVPGEDQHY
jgi:hypothetical protein